MFTGHPVQYIHVWFCGILKSVYTAINTEREVPTHPSFSSILPSTNIKQ